MGGGAYLYDLLGRLTGQTDTVEGGAVLYDHSQVWDAKGRVWQDNVYQKQGNDLVTTNTTNYYSDDAGSGYALGALTSSVSTGHRYVNGYSYQASPGATTTIGYAWFDGAVQAQVSYAVAGSAAQNTWYTNGPSGSWQSASVQDGRPRGVGNAKEA